MFFYLTLVIRTNANEMYMQRQYVYLSSSLFYYKNLIYLGFYFEVLTFISSRMYGLINDKNHVLSIPNANTYAFYDSTRLQRVHSICI